MPFKKYVANKDTTITNAYKLDLINRATDANMGASDSLEMFSIFGQANTSSVEKSRVLVQMPITSISLDRTNSKIPASGSVSFYLRMFNVEHPFSVPKDYTASVAVVSQSWDEGYGLDMESYSDIGWGTSIKGSGATWTYATSGTMWATTGSSFLTSSGRVFDVPFSTGIEDIELDVTNVVEDWMAGTIPNYGFVIRMSGTYENGDLLNSFYTKKFSARGSEYFFKKPVIEARWESITLDDRNKFYLSSSFFDAADNKMNLYFYNKSNGVLKNLAGSIMPGVLFYASASLTASSLVSESFSSITNPSTGVYRAQVAINTTHTTLYDKWYNTSSLATAFSSSFNIGARPNYDYNTDTDYVINITNLKTSYNENEVGKFKVYVREKDWQPTIYTVANNLIENSVLTNLYYKIFRLNDSYTVVDYSTGSLAYTKVSYDGNGNHFEIDMSVLEKKYVYGVKLAKYEGTELKEYPTVYKFKVE